MKRLIVVCALMLMAAALLGVTHIPGGDVNGVWTQDESPYYIYGDICVPDGQTLFINPGTEIRFSGNYYFEVQGRVVAMGTQQDSVLFTGPETAGWHGLRFLNTPSTNDSSLFSYCRFENGRAIYASQTNSKCGGIFNIEEFHKIRISHSQFYNNIAEYFGGAIFSYLGSVKVTDCVFDNCFGSSGGGAVHGAHSSIYFTNNIVMGCSTSYGSGGGVSMHYGDIELKQNTFVNNSAVYNGGGVWLKSISSGTVQNNKILNNTATYDGGGLYFYAADVFCASNLICNNTATTGGGIYTEHHDLEIENNTICMNQADEGSAVAFQQNTNCQMVNCIIYGNESLNSNQIAIHPETSPIITYCMWQDCPNISLYPHCFRTEPDFVAPSGGAGTAYSAMDADWSMLPTSIAINTGSPDFIFTNIPDIAGNPRIHDDIIDCGAYEYQSTPTIQCDIEASSTVGNIPFLVQFYGICNAVDASYEWDFNNDGIVDSNEHDPQYTYNEVGQYTVHLHVVNASGNHDCTKTDYITTIPLTTLQGTITTNTTLPAGIIQITGEVEIASGVTLSIQPGTTLQFQDHYAITVFGRMEALGTEADSIYFTVVDPTGFNNMNIDDGGWGGLFFDCSDPTMQPSQFAHCVFTYGKAVGGGEQSKGGVMYNDGTNQVDVSDSRFHTNRAMNSGGAVYANGPMLLTGCILENNQAQRGGAIGTAELVTLNNCILQNNQADEYGGALFTDFLININNSIVQDNTAGIDGGGLCSWSWADLDGTTFVGNYADNFGGGVCFNHYGHVWVTNSIFANNQSDDLGGGMYVSCDTDFSIINSLVCNNSGDGILIDNTDSHIVNCDFVNNDGFGIAQITSPWDGEARDTGELKSSTEDTKAPCYNCINWGNSEGEDWISASYELYNVDPCFAAPSAGYGIQYDGLAADWRLTEPSMCINYGMADTTGLNLPQFDLDGNPRIFAGAIGRVDIGPYEYQDDPVRPYMYCDKSGLDFGVITLGYPEEDQMVTLYNVGTDELIINSITVSEGFEVQILGQEWTTQLADIHIQPGQFKFINVRFNPAEIGVYNGVMIIDSNHIEPMYTIPLSGECVVYAMHVGGTYAGSPVWDAPYIVFDSTVIIQGDSLTIMPGVHLIMDDAELRLYRCLIAEGTETDSIYFTSSHGHSRGKIQLSGYGSGTSRLAYCVIENSAFSGLNSGYSSSYSYSIKNSIIQNNQSAGMCMDCGNSTIEDCIIRNNHGGGFLGNGIVNRCIFTENEGNAAICQAGSVSHLDVVNSLIYNNESALDVRICDLWNCTIADNGSGLFWECVNHSNIMKNCILWGNDANGVQITLDNSTNHQGAIYNSCIQGGFDNLVITGTTNMTYLNNIDADPLFVGASMADYHLNAGSPCIDEGTNTVDPIVEPGDLEHHQRIWDGDNSGVATIDMGCYEAGAPVGVPHMNIGPAVTTLLGNYPNPFNPTTEIMFNLTAKDAKDAKIEIFNIKGQKVKKLEMRNEELEMRREGTGVCSLIWDGTDSTNRPVASGVYFYQLKVGSTPVAQRKMMLLK